MISDDWDAACAILPTWANELGVMESALAECPIPSNVFLGLTRYYSFEAIEELVAGTNSLFDACTISESSEEGLTYQLQALGHIVTANELTGAATDALDNYTVSLE